MLRNHQKFSYLRKTAIILTALGCFGCSGVRFNPSHHSRFQFSGVVRTSEGKPIENAIVKVNGWEVLTDSQGRWNSDQVLFCGALREDPSGKKEFDTVLFMADGYESHEENYMISHPAWFGSCEDIQPVVYQTTLLTKKETKSAKKEDSSSSEEPSLPPQPTGGTVL